MADKIKRKVTLRSKRTRVALLGSSVLLCAAVMWVNFSVGIVSFCFLLISTLGLVRHLFVLRRVLEVGEEVVGKITAIRSAGRYGGYLIVEYEYLGKRFSERAPGTHLANQKFAVGQTVTVFVDPANPTSIVVLEGAEFEVAA